MFPTIRTGEVTAKAAKTDQEFQTFAVRETEAGLEYWHKQLSGWFALPAEWADSVRWEASDDQAKE